MRIHILGIGGTFMAGLAVLAKELGHDVQGSDMTLYPPMSTALLNHGITVMEGYDASHFKDSIDLVIVGNVIKRGNPAMEHILNERIPYISGPEWLAREVLHKRRVIAIAGTHGKTTTTSMTAWLLDQAGFAPGFLIGGIPENFGVSARLGDGDYFVIEADEYDSAFFDKRSKFLHYRPEILVLNNLEFDHADIFADLNAIKLSFHYLVRTVPNNGLIIYPENDSALQDVLAKDVWTPEQKIGPHTSAFVKLIRPDASEFQTTIHDETVSVNWSLLGEHNAQNALAALSVLKHIGGSLAGGAEALASFKNVKRRLEVKGVAGGVTVYDDFAHHPTAIAATIAALRAKIKDARLFAVLEFGSYTMRSGVHKATLPDALKLADTVLCKMPSPDWGVGAVLEALQVESHAYAGAQGIIDFLRGKVLPGDHILIMSNGAFEGIHEKLLVSLIT